MELSMLLNETKPPLPEDQTIKTEAKNTGPEVNLSKPEVDLSKPGGRFI